MLSSKISIFCVAFVCCLFAVGVLLVINKEYLRKEKREYEQDMKRLLSLSEMKDIEGLDRFADELQAKWNRINEESYADSILAVCGNLSSGRFNDERQYNLARKLAILALTDPNEIPLETQLKLVGHVMTDMITPSAPKGQEWARKRRKDLEVRLHAWKRLTKAIDPNWDPNDMPLATVPLPIGVSGITGMAPEHIKNPKLRAEYEAAIEQNRQKAKKYAEQYTLRKWLRRFPHTAEEYIVRAYSKAPFDLAELKQSLEMYITDEKTRDRILGAVTKNVNKRTKNVSKESME
jgi:hypothetical protein